MQKHCEFHCNIIIKKNLRIMKAQKKKYLLYFSIYLITKLMYVYINAYLPIYFAFASAVNITKLGLVLFVSYSFMFAKPLLAIYFDKSSNNSINNKGSKRKMEQVDHKGMSQGDPFS